MNRFNEELDSIYSQAMNQPHSFETQKEIYLYLRSNLELLLTAKSSMAEDKMGSCKVEPYNGLTLRQLLRMEIAMYYTIQKIESQIKILKAREAVKL
jgi:hypothetical protein